MPEESNPYAFDESEDDDIFAHLEKQKQTNRGRIDDVIARMNLPSDMPPQVREKLADFLATLPDEVLDSVHVIADKLDSDGENFLSKFAHFIEIIESLNYNGSLLRAMAEVLDDISNGEVSRRWKLYRYEQILIAQHEALKILNNMMATLSEEADMDGKEEMYALLENIVQSVVSRIHEIGEDYKKYAKSHDYPTHQKIIDNGLYEDGSLPDYVKSCIVTAFQAELMVIKNTKRL